MDSRSHLDSSVQYAQDGCFAQALAHAETAMALGPQDRAIWHHYLTLQKSNPAQPSPAEWRAMHLGYGDTLRDRLDARHLHLARSREPGRRLRVGYLCPDTHIATERLMWPAFEHFDGDAFEVFAYWCRSPVTAGERYPRVTHHSIHGLDDEATIQRLVDDAIDIVVDLAGHGPGNVLPALAARPAPVRLTWLHHLATTGLETVDYRITDEIADPPGAEAAHVEKLLRLPIAPWCYRPVPGTEQEALAREPSDAILFGSVCAPLKLSDTVLDLWAELLQRLPLSRLRLLGIPEGRARTRVIQRFTAAGLGMERLDLRPRLSLADFTRALAELDVVLDSHPYSGTASSLDALWQGVPVVTLAGALSHSRSTASILTALGRGEWIADSRGRFLDIAVALASDHTRLRAERATLRESLRRSSLCDGPGFARALEKAFQHAWSTSLARSETSPREDSAAFWRDFRALASRTPSHPRTPLSQVAQVVDVSSGEHESIARGGSDWVLLTASAFYDPSVFALAIPSHLLDAYDVLAPLGADLLRGGEIAMAGQGHVRGATMAGDRGSDRLSCSLWVPEGFGRCVALSGSVILVRRSQLQGRRLPWPSGLTKPEFGTGVLRLSQELHRDGARLGVATSLAIPERDAELDPREEYAAYRAVERDLGLPRWAQERPAATPVKAVFTRAGWTTTLPVVERLCDSDPLE